MPNAPGQAPVVTPTCFHVETKIFGKSLDQIAAEKECAIPHVVSALGVVVHSTCSPSPLRLTDDHLVFSSSGRLVAAKDLHVGQLLFSDLAETEAHRCHVTRIEREKTEQKVKRERDCVCVVCAYYTLQYFGLNCPSSVVLANGVKTSTFGRHHWIAATYMSLMSKVIGVHAASTFGDFWVQLLARIGLI